jgi:predicted Zn-dependent protease with MMP-like domain
LALAAHRPHIRAMKRRTADGPDAAAIEQMALAAVGRIPRLFRDHLAGVIIRVEEFADEETLQELGMDDPWGLTGLYHGRPISEQSIWSSGDLPPVISLYRRPLIEEWAETGVALDDLVTHVVIHEVGHHFGLSDDEIYAIEDDAD